MQEPKPPVRAFNCSMMFILPLIILPLLTLAFESNPPDDGADGDGDGVSCQNLGADSASAGSSPVAVDDVRSLIHKFCARGKKTFPQLAQKRGSRR